LAVTNNGVNLKTLAAQNARSVTDGKRLMFSAETPVSIAANYGPDRIDAVLNSNAGKKIVLFVGERPVRVLMDGNEIPARSIVFDAAANTIALNIPAGRREIRIVLK